MKIKLNQLKRGGKCRYCKRTARWELWRENNTFYWVRHCDEHLGIALRNLGLTKLTIEHTAVCTAEVRP